MKSLRALIENSNPPTRFAQALGLQAREETGMDSTELDARLQHFADRLHEVGLTSIQLAAVREVFAELLLDETPAVAS